jgi:hypothetical protein
MQEPSQDELDEMRIRKLAILRRAAYRSRSYCIIAVVACAVGIMQLVDDAVGGWNSGRGHLRQIAYLAAAGGLFCLGILFWRWSVRFHQEAKRSALDTPLHPPDFSKLSDGSQRARNLENM